MTGTPKTSTVKYGSLPFAQAIAYFKNKQNIGTERWADIWRNGHNSAFMIAGAMKNDLLNDFRGAVDRAIAEGKSFTWFQKEFKNIKAKHGWNHTGNEAWRSKVIFDTNMRQSYNAGRYEQLQHFDFWQYKHGDSRQPRELHQKWNGTLLPKDDPWWETHFVQNGWGCKCKIFGRTQAYLDRKGLTVSQRPNDGTREWIDKTTGEVHNIPKGIDPGFDYAPQKSTILKQQKKLAVKKAKPFKAPSRIVPSAFSTVPGVDVHGLNHVLDKLNKTSAAPQVKLLGKFLQKHQTKTVFIKQKEMSPKSVASAKIENAVESYLGRNPIYRTRMFYTDNGYLRTHGFTSRVFNHVVIKAKGKFNAVDINELTRSIEAAILLSNSGMKTFNFSEMLLKHADGGINSSLVTTWLHEIGHQIHFKAGTPSSGIFDVITNYSRVNSKEWHAEMFVAWVLDRKALAAWNNEIAEYMDNLMSKAINNG